MSGLIGEALKQFEAWNDQGQAANKAGQFREGFAIFCEMDKLARLHNDPLKRIHSLTPAAKSLWSIKEYAIAQCWLKDAQEIATEIKRPDEIHMTNSNLGRLAAVRIVNTVSLPDQAEALSDEAVPLFMQAYQGLIGDPHLYYRYANAQHGSVVAALAGQKRAALKLAAEGAAVAPWDSPPYNEQRTYQINPRGLAQLGAAVLLAPLGPKTPVLADVARQNMVR